MIDLWFMFLLILVVLTIIFHTAITFILGPDNPHYNLKHSHTSKIFKHREEDDSVPNSQASSATRIRRLEEQHNLDEEEQDYLENIELAKKANLIGMVVFVVILVVFNIAFWVVALSQHSQPISDFLTTVKDKF